MRFYAFDNFYCFKNAQWYRITKTKIKSSFNIYIHFKKGYNMASNNGNKVFGIILLIMALLCGFLLLDRTLGSNVILTPDFMYPIALLLLFSGGIVNAFRKDARGFFRIILGWIMVFATIIFGYDMYNNYKNNQIAERTQGMVPDYVMQKNGAHFYTNVYVNGVSIPFMLDSGASLVVLTKESAERAGIDVDSLTEHVIVSTANGEKIEKTTYVKEMRLGDVVFKDIRVAISVEGLNENLLGNSFMKHFSQKVEVGNELRLWK